jgi:hypothetical protein
MSLIQIAKAQVILQYSINEVAKEVSTYSYILTKAGIVSKRVETAERAEKFSEEGVAGAVETMVTTLSESGLSKDTVNGAVDELVEELLSTLKTKGADMLSDAVIQEIAKKEVEKQIEAMSNKSADQYLRDLGIEDGMDGLDFSDTKWADAKADDADMPELEVAVSYTIKLNLVYLGEYSKKYELCAKTALW